MKSILMIPMTNSTITVSPNIGTGTMRIIGRVVTQGKVAKAHLRGTIHLGTTLEARNLGKKAITTAEIPRRVLIRPRYAKAMEKESEHMNFQEV